MCATILVQQIQPLLSSSHQHSDIDTDAHVSKILLVLYDHSWDLIIGDDTFPLTLDPFLEILSGTQDKEGGAYKKVYYYFKSSLYIILI